MFPPLRVARIYRNIERSPWLDGNCLRPTISTAEWPSSNAQRLEIFQPTGWLKSTSWEKAQPIQRVPYDPTALFQTTTALCAAALNDVHDRLGLSVHDIHGRAQTVHAFPSSARFLLMR
ncbi:hypothetical protein AC1031_021972 [Aphanomyces cochlioides]|nr:hypothetical protein AC1031_021972 [Aphanomyces cochlioides]